MPLISFDSPIVERNEKIADESVIQIEVNNNNKSKAAQIEKAESIKRREAYLSIKEDELLVREEILRKKEEKIKLIVQAMIKKDEEIKRKEAFLIKLIPKN